ncbi:cell division protein ZapE [Pseudemcibacter aquimaris]|uniref:cell division protein ZapE n=1 Tax=Pseudemcibacter aquimaris TaxID=2857064 RepID=UPI002011BA3A|nr:cell division protein ZapE [Pseudemcibacter aquimaris]MCC3861667.1 cell division protein ZapE [Pseudemcibacter aquimaris]WDU58438.1 AFG1 family ATPase [Pseudemcibacter aquimaris]
MTYKSTEPDQLYHEMLEKGELKEDPIQYQVVQKFQKLYQALKEKSDNGQRKLLSKLFSKKQENPHLKGLYIYGDVGRGKSMLMDLFYDLAPGKKRRVHFHAFMLEIHQEMHDWRYMSGDDRIKKFGTKEDDPIPPLAAQIAEHSPLLCFDEFQVTDVTDAMILGRLFQALFDRGVILVLTSNRIPDDLYKDGLNRGLFLPTIDMIKEKLEIIQLDGPTDYRLERMKGMAVYHHPLGEKATKALSESFWKLTDHEVDDRSEVGPEEIEVQGRILHVPVASRGVAVVSFKKMCAAALGAADYLALAWKYHTIIMVGIPKLGPENRNEAKRFVTFIDALYENNVKFLCCAEASPEELYAEGHGHFEFQRTVSRLMEMQSKEYLAKGHAI